MNIKDMDFPEDFPCFGIYLSKRIPAFNPEWAEDMPENLRSLPCLTEGENAELDDWCEYMESWLDVMIFPVFLRVYEGGGKISLSVDDEGNTHEFIGYVLSDVGNDETIEALEFLSRAWSAGVKDDQIIQELWKIERLWKIVQLWKIALQMEQLSTDRKQ